MTPFIVLGLPRSRTFWLSRFLTYGNWHCGHEEARHGRSLGDAQAWLSQDFTGTAETGIARWWRLLRHFQPDIRIAVVRRPVADVVRSLLALDMRGVCTFDRGLLEAGLRRMDRALDQIERMPGVLSVGFADLADEATCARVFEHTLQLPHDHDHWAALAPVNLQCNMPALMRYAIAHRAQMAATGSACRRQMRAILHPPSPAKVQLGEPDAMGITIQEESIATMIRDGSALLEEHCRTVGEAPDQWRRKNLPMMARLEQAGAWQMMSARCNGRVLAYLACIVGPSLEDPGVIAATQTLFCVSADAKGMRLGMRLQRAAVETLRDRGVTEIYARAGVRGSGPRLGVMYRRLGAEEFGQLYKLKVA